MSGDGYGRSIGRMVRKSRAVAVEKVYFAGFVDGVQKFNQPMHTRPIKTKSVRKLMLNYLGLQTV
jgi:hypothetical protein